MNLLWLLQLGVICMTSGHKCPWIQVVEANFFTGFFGGGSTPATPIATKATPNAQLNANQSNSPQLASINQAQRQPNIKSTPSGLRMINNNNFFNSSSVPEATGSTLTTRVVGGNSNSALTTNSQMTNEFNQTFIINSEGNQELPNPNINNAGHEITKILKKFFQTGYDKRVRPNYSGPPAMVNVSFHIIGISSVSEVQMDFTADFYFRQKWYDPRLEFKPVNNIDELCVGAEFAEKIWLPDTFFANEKTATFHKATTENTFIRVAHNGRVYRSIRLTVTCSCPMDLQYFPMDRQRCKIEIESYGYNTRDINYRWEKGNESVSLDGKIELPQFKVLGFKMGQTVQSLSSGDYIRLYCEVHFVRSMGYYLIQIYIPASLIVIISWVSFWLHRNATPARVALGVTTVLTMTTLMSSTNAALPKISYIKSIDVFLGTCFVMVFASLLEYASVGYIGKRIAMKRKRKQDLQQLQQHHQKVCLAAAASAAAAASKAQKTNPVAVAPALQRSTKGAILGQLPNKNNNHRPILMMTTTLGNCNSSPVASNGLHQTHAMAYPGRPTCGLEPAIQQQQANNNPTTPAASWTRPLSGLGWSHTARAVADLSLGGYQANNSATHPGTAHQIGPKPPPVTSVDSQQQVEPASAQQPGAQSNASQSKADTAEEITRICGLTPSAIDKYSRVVFPICFVCFNLMYWIIYGHISQQMDDGDHLPLIPFIRS